MSKKLDRFISQQLSGKQNHLPLNVLDTCNCFVISKEEKVMSIVVKPNTSINTVRNLGKMTFESFIKFIVIKFSSDIKTLNDSIEYLSSEPIKKLVW